MIIFLISVLMPVLILKKPIWKKRWFRKKTRSHRIRFGLQLVRISFWVDFVMTDLNPSIQLNRASWYWCSCAAYTSRITTGYCCCWHTSSIITYMYRAEGFNSAVQYTFSVTGVQWHREAMTHDAGTESEQCISDGTRGNECNMLLRRLSACQSAPRTSTCYSLITSRVQLLLQQPTLNAAWRQ